MSVGVCFSPRELQIIAELVKDGADNPTIARRLGYLSVETVKTHIKSIFLKTHVSNRAALVVAIYRLDVVPLQSNGMLADVGLA